MNDLESDLRELLEQDADRVSTPTEPPPDLRRRARRRQAASIALGASGGIAIVLAIALSLGVVAPLAHRERIGDAGTGASVTATIAGVTISYRTDWALAAGPDSEQAGRLGLPHVVFTLAAGPRSMTCPATTGGTFHLIVQEDLPQGVSTPPWPVQLGPSSGDLSNDACYRGWSFEEATWTASGRTFTAYLATSPSITDDERRDVQAAFESMTFAPSSPPEPRTVLAVWASSGQRWPLIARRSSGGLELELRTPSGSNVTVAGFSGRTLPLRVGQEVIERSTLPTRVLFGAVRSDVGRIVVADANGNWIGEAAIQPLGVESPLDPVWRPWFVSVDPNLGASLVVLDRNGEVMATRRLGRSP